MHGASGSPGQVHELKMYFAGQPGWGEFQPCVGWPAPGVPGDFSRFWSEKGKSGMRNAENQSCRWLSCFSCLSDILKNWIKDWSNYTQLLLTIWLNSVRLSQAMQKSIFEVRKVTERLNLGTEFKFSYPDKDAVVQTPFCARTGDKGDDGRWFSSGYPASDSKMLCLFLIYEQCCKYMQIPL